MEGHGHVRMDPLLPVKSRGTCSTCLTCKPGCMLRCQRLLCSHDTRGAPHAGSGGDGGSSGRAVCFAGRGCG
jgi:hypothetical protein